MKRFNTETRDRLFRDELWEAISAYVALPSYGGDAKRKERAAADVDAVVDRWLNAAEMDAYNHAASNTASMLAVGDFRAAEVVGELRWMAHDASEKRKPRWARD